MRIIVAGASGFLGRPLVEHLRGRDHDVVRLVRREATADDESTWDPYAGQVDRGLIGKSDAVVNLAAASNKGNPYSRRWADALLESRVTTTRVLAEAVSAAETPPAYVVGVGTSAYGDHGTSVVTEESPDRGGDALLARVVRAWEAAARPAFEAGGRVVLMRQAPIVHPGNVPTQQLIPLFRLLPRRSRRQRAASTSRWCPWRTGRPRPPSSPRTTCRRAPTTCVARRRPPTVSSWRPWPGSCTAGRRSWSRPSCSSSPWDRSAPELTNSTNLRPEALLREGFTFQDDDVAKVVATALAAR